MCTCVHVCACVFCGVCACMWRQVYQHHDTQHVDEGCYIELLHLWLAACGLRLVVKSVLL